MRLLQGPHNNTFTRQNVELADPHADIEEVREKILSDIRHR